MVPGQPVRCLTTQSSLTAPERMSYHTLFIIIPLDGIVSHLKKQAGPASVEIKSVAEFEKFTGDRDASVVGE